jgi:hypothetical protein
MKRTSFLRVFVDALLHTVWTYLAIASTCITFLPLPPTWRKAVPFGIAVLFVISAYRTSWRLRQATEREHERLLEQIEDLKKRPYDVDHRKLAEGKLQELTTTGRDLLRFLLHRGRTDFSFILAACQTDRKLFQEAFEAMRLSGLIVKSDQQAPGRASLIPFLEINPEFTPMLKDLLYPRDEPDREPHFRF